MDWKEIVGGLIFVFFGIPLLIQLIAFTSTATDPDVNQSERVEEGSELIASAVIPWWLNPLTWLASLPGKLGAIAVIGFIFFLRWLGVFD